MSPGRHAEDGAAVRDRKGKNLVIHVLLHLDLDLANDHLSIVYAAFESLKACLKSLFPPSRRWRLGCTEFRDFRIMPAKYSEFRVTPSISKLGNQSAANAMSIRKFAICSGFFHEFCRFPFSGNLA